MPWPFESGEREPTAKGAEIEGALAVGLLTDGQHPPPERLRLIFTWQRSASLDASWWPDMQTGKDDEPEVIIDPSTGEIRCLSCHGRLYMTVTKHVMHAANESKNCPGSVGEANERAGFGYPK